MSNCMKQELQQQLTEAQQELSNWEHQGLPEMMVALHRTAGLKSVVNAFEIVLRSLLASWRRNEHR